jgi:hypothetical protein
MENYNIIKTQLNNQLLFKLSQIGYALYSDVLFTNRIPSIDQTIHIINHLKNDDKIFISVLPNELTINVYELVDILKRNNIKVNLYLMYEPILPFHILELLLPVSNHLFLNNNIYNHPQIHSMPIGIRDCEKVVPNHKGFSHELLYNEGLNMVTKEYLCILCYSYTHDERYRCYNQLKNMPFVLNLNDGTYDKQPSIHCGKVPVWINYEYTHKSVYTLSPRGAGEDCHRFYEAIYLDSIPIVKRTNTAFDKLYEIFPCLIINDWSDITEEFLLEKKDECLCKLENFKSKYPNAFTDLDSIHELLLQT